MLLRSRGQRGDEITITFDPITGTTNQFLLPNQKYLVTIEDIEDAGSGDALPSPLVYTFTTGPNASITNPITQNGPLCQANGSTVTLNDIVIKEGAPGNFRKFGANGNKLDITISLPDGENLIFASPNDNEDDEVRFSAGDLDGLTPVLEYRSSNNKTMAFGFLGKNTMGNSFSDEITISGLQVRVMGNVEASTHPIVVNNIDKSYYDGEGEFTPFWTSDATKNKRGFYL